MSDYLHGTSVDSITCKFVESHRLYALQAFDLRELLIEACKNDEYGMIPWSDVYACAVELISKRTFDISDAHSLKESMTFVIGICEFAKYIENYSKGETNE